MAHKRAIASIPSGTLSSRADNLPRPTRKGGRMTTYRLIFTKKPGHGTARSVSFTADDASEALLLAQRHESPAQL